MIVQNLRQDLTYALRQLRRSPGFAAIAVLTLALGIGANTAIFSILDQALLRSLPVKHPEQLVILEGTGDAWQGHSSSHGGDKAAYFSYPMYKDLRDRSAAFQGLIAIDQPHVGVSFRNQAILAQADLVSGNYFELLGVQPALGRVFTQQEDLQPNAVPVAVLSYAFWKSRLGGDASVVGQTLTINAHPFTIVGVAAPGFQSAIAGESSDLFVPMMMLGQVKTRYGAQDDLTLHTSRWLTILGRLKPGETRQQAQVALVPLWKALRAEELKALGHRSPKFVASFLTNSELLVLPGAKGFSFSRDTLSKPLYVVMGMAVLVLLMATVNVASLLLVRSAGRLREFSLRYALGADRARILQQLLLEGLLIGIAGGAAAIAMAPLATRVLIQQLAGGDGESAFTAAITSQVLFFNFAIAVVVSVFFSLAPAVQLLKPDLMGAMKQQSGTASGNLLGLRRVVVCVQIGLSILLLAGAGLFVRTMQNLRHVDVGFSTDHLVTFGIDPIYAGYVMAQIPQLHQRILDTLGALPGVRSVSATDQQVLAGDSHGGNVEVPGFVEPPDTNYDIEEDFITPEFLKNMQTPLLAGRMFTEADDAAHPNVIIVNETFAKHFFGSAQAALGRRVNRIGGKNVSTEIVGVAADTLHESIRSAVSPTLFRPVLQNETPGAMQFYVRTSLAPEEMMPAIRRSMQQLDGKLALDGLRTMEQQIDENLSNERMIVLLAISFGALATLLAGIGLYGVLAYVTAQRTREIGVRIALGSSRAAISGIVLTDVLKLAGISIAVAVPVALGLARLLKSQLFGVSSSDPVTFLCVTFLVAIVAVVSALVPAHRAANVDPIKALRTE
jgi:predicted permease